MSTEHNPTINRLIRETVVPRLATKSCAAALAVARTALGGQLDADERATVQRVYELAGDTSLAALTRLGRIRDVLSA